ncbi:MAG: HPr family phosphocarrier protein [Deltaproteobacteria bacterium]|nr:HPr family phosphocarrier protein [Deltaproteobacteria bacterium]MDL1960432.1 HPr family phosphocarrier protein [Deltaproteobacteria bacterium]
MIHWSEIMECEATVTILNRLGLHARAASRFAQKANEFNADVWLVKDGEKVDGKNILEVLTFACPHGSVLTVRAVGLDANQAVRDLKILVESRFGELD